MTKNTDYLTSLNGMPFVHLNCNGHRYQIKKEVFSKLNNGILKNADVYFDPTLQQVVYFIPRSYVGLDAILNYFDSGELHMPLSVCPVDFEKELHLWGLNMTALETCCQIKWQDFKGYQTQIQSVIGYFQPDIPPTKGEDCSWQTIRKASWSNFNTTRWENASVLARVILVIKVLAICLFIFESIAASLPAFKERMSHQGVADYINTYEAELRCLCEETKCPNRADNMEAICKILNQKTCLSTSTHVNVSQQGNTSRKRRHADEQLGTRQNDITHSRRKMINNQLKAQRINSTISAFVARSVKTNIAVNVESGKHINDKSAMLTNSTHHFKNKSLRFKRFVIGTRPSVVSGDDEGISRTRSELLHNTQNILVKRSVDNTQTTNVFLCEEVSWLEHIELALFVFFTFEYLIGIICSPVRWKYILGFFGVIDLLYLCTATFLHVYLDLIYPERKYLHTQIDLFLAIESLKVFKMLYYVQHVNSYKVLMLALTQNSSDISHLLIYMFMWMFVISFVMYELEREIIKTLPNALYWTIVTLSSVGYGDIFPQTDIGKLISAITALSGIIWMAFLVPVFVEDFILFHRFSKRDPIENKDIMERESQKNNELEPSAANISRLADYQASNTPPTYSQPQISAVEISRHMSRLPSIYTMTMDNPNKQERSNS